VCHCGSNIAGIIDVKSVLDFAKTLPNVVHVQDQTYSCAANTLNEISGVIRDKKINRVVVAACSPKTHYPTFQGALNRAGLNSYLLDMANIRNMDSWVHKEDRNGALQKAKDMVRMSVLRAINMKPLQTMRFPVTQTALVVGGGVAGLVAATNLAKQGFETHLVEKRESLGGLLNSIKTVAPLGLESRTLLDSLLRELQESGAKVHTGTEVQTISGFVGSYHVHLTDGSDFIAGAVVVATGARPYVPDEFEHGKNPNVVTSLELDAIIDSVSGKKVSIISCVGSRNDSSGCSRFCCQTMINQAIRLKEGGNDVNVLYKDIRTFSRFGEEEYARAGKMGVRFYQYPQSSLPQQSIQMTDGGLVVRDELSGREVALQSDLTVLNIGLTRRGAPND
jgi:heterodisulfide reductase subunit A